MHADPSLKIFDPIIIRNLNNSQEINVQNNTNGYSHFHTINQFYQINLRDNLPIGQYSLTFRFKNDYGSIANLVGFHKVSYLEDGIVK